MPLRRQAFHALFASYPCLTAWCGMLPSLPLPLLQTTLYHTFGYV